MPICYFCKERCIYQGLPGEGCPDGAITTKHPGPKTALLAATAPERPQMELGKLGPCSTCGDYLKPCRCSLEAELKQANDFIARKITEISYLQEQNHKQFDELSRLQAETEDLRSALSICATCAKRQLVPDLKKYTVYLFRSPDCLRGWLAYTKRDTYSHRATVTVSVLASRGDRAKNKAITAANNGFQGVEVVEVNHTDSLWGLSHFPEVVMPKEGR